MSQQYYVYLLKDPTTLLPFYVGKGKGKRAKSHMTPSMLIGRSHKNSRIKSILANNQYPIIEYVSSSLTEEQAFSAERSLIAEYGRIDTGTGILTNHTDGGDGATGAKHSKESVEQMRLKKIGVKRTAEQRKNISKGQQGKTNSKESNLSRSQTLSGANSPTALIIDIFDQHGILQYTAHGNFIPTCKKYDLPGYALSRSYKSGGIPIFQTRVGRKKYANFRLWVAKIRDNSPTVLES